MEIEMNYKDFVGSMNEEGDCFFKIIDTQNQSVLVHITIEQRNDLLNKVKSFSEDKL